MRDLDMRGDPGSSGGTHLSHESLSAENLGGRGDKRWRVKCGRRVPSAIVGSEDGGGGSPRAREHGRPQAGKGVSRFLPGASTGHCPADTLLMV